MMADEALLEACAEWRRLAQAVNTAIQSRRWDFVVECQALIHRLQPQITRLSRQARDERASSAKADGAGGEKLESIVLELIKLVESNKSLLNSAQERVTAEHEQRQQASRNLKRLQQSYAAMHQPAWSSLS